MIIRNRIILLALLLLASCLPVSTATFDVGTGLSVSDLGHAEEIIESFGFVLSLCEQDGQKKSRCEYADRIVSEFESPGEPGLRKGFGVGILLYKHSGALKVVIAERDTDFSEQGRLLLRDIEEALQHRFGGQVKKLSKVTNGGGAGLTSQ